MLIQIMVLVILILLNAFFAASEIALLSANENKLERMAAKGNKKAVLLSKLISEPSQFLATIQIGITLAGFLASAFASDSFADVLTDAVMASGISISRGIVKNISMVLITLLLSYFTLVFGELVPKRLAMKRGEKIAMSVVRPLYYLAKGTYPFVKLLTLSTDLTVRLFGIDPNEDDNDISEEEIRLMVDVGEEKGAINEDEKNMIFNVFEFNNKTVTNIMTHRTNLAALPLDSSLQDVVDFVQKWKFSRIPVYEDDLDDIVGILHTKELINYFCTHSENEDETKCQSFRLADIIKEPYVVPESKRIDELFKEMQLKQIQIAIVIDEYGGTAGIVTSEDMIEEIVGEIFDEYDHDYSEMIRISANRFRIMGSMELDKLQRALNIDLPVDDFETLNGFLISQLDDIPEPDEHPKLCFEDYEFTVEAADGKKISSVIAAKLAKSSQSASANTEDNAQKD